MRKVLLVLTAATFMATTCEKDKGYVSATVIATGDITQEGCGYLLKMTDGKLEKPYQLPSAFQHNDLKVKVKLKASGILDTCQFEPPHSFYELVYVEDIKKD